MLGISFQKACRKIFWNSLSACVDTMLWFCCVLCKTLHHIDRSCVLSKPWILGSIVVGCFVQSFLSVSGHGLFVEDFISIFLLNIHQYIFLLLQTVEFSSRRNFHWLYRMSWNVFSCSWFARLQEELGVNSLSNWQNSKGSHHSLGRASVITDLISFLVKDLFSYLPPWISFYSADFLGICSFY